MFYSDTEKKWIARLELEPDPTTGKRRVKVVRGNTKEEAQKKYDRLRQKHQAGQLGGETMTLATCLEYWLDGRVKTRVDSGTYALHKQRVEDYILPHLGHFTLAKLTPFTVTHWLQTLENEGHSADLRNKVGQLLRRCLDHAVRLKLLPENVARLADLPRVNVEEMHPLDEAQTRHFLATAGKNRLYPLYLLALDSGMRQGEIIALEWADIDFATGIVSITRSAKWEKGGVRIKEVKTRASRRRIRLTRPTLEALATLRQKSKGKLVFPSRGCGPRYGKDVYLNKANLRRAFKKLLVKAGLPDVRFHDLRHTHATLALLKTKNIKAVSTRLGHADIRVTLNTYSHFLPVMEDELVAAMEELLTPQLQEAKADTTEVA